jgi:hypothetical protein
MAPISEQSSKSRNVAAVAPQRPAKRSPGFWAVSFAAVALVGLALYGGFRLYRGSPHTAEGIAPGFDVPSGWHAETARGPNFGFYTDGSGNSVSIAGLLGDNVTGPDCDRMIAGMMRSTARKAGLEAPPAATSLPSTGEAVCRFRAEIPGHQLVSGGYVLCHATGSGVLFAYYRGSDAADDRGIIERIHCPG